MNFRLMTCLLLFCSLLLAWCGPGARALTFTPDADTYTRADRNAGAATDLDVRGFGGGDFVAYVRFDISSITDTIADATFTLHETAASRNDGITTERHEVHGLTNDAGNTPQDWDEATLVDVTVNVGAEYTNVGGARVDLAQVVNLDADDGANIIESVPGTDGVPVSITGPDLVTFLNDRLADNGLVTFITTINSTNRGYGFASKENTDPALWPTLDVTLVPEPMSGALASMAGLALLALGRRR